MYGKYVTTAKVEGTRRLPTRNLTTMTDIMARKMGEFDYIDWLRRQTPGDARVLVGPGDDCAVLAAGAEPWLVTTDMLLEGSHFRIAETGPERVGRKAMAVNLSDIAAMAGRPVAAVISVGLP